jgi:F-type H+-transporting ATPase subunit delta
MAQLIPNRYSKALFELALKDNSIDELENDALLICSLFKENPDYIKVLNHPQITSKEKLISLETIFKGNVSDTIIGLINVLLQKNRETYFLEILKDFLFKVDSHKGIATAYITSATELTDLQLSVLKEKLSKNINKQIEVQLIVDKSLIGGISINVDGLFIDSSIKKQLLDMKKQLLTIQLA